MWEKLTSQLIIIKWEIKLRQFIAWQPYKGQGLPTECRPHIYMLEDIGDKKFQIFLVLNFIFKMATVNVKLQCVVIERMVTDNATSQHWQMYVYSVWNRYCVDRLPLGWESFRKLRKKSLWSTMLRAPNTLNCSTVEI